MNINSTIFYVIIASLFMVSCTTLGAASIYIFKKQNDNLMHFMMSFAAGIMIAGSFFSLINPAIESCATKFDLLVFVGTGALLGFVFMILSEKIIANDNANSFSAKRLTLSITLHNIPEGMCVGVAFALAQNNPALITSAIALAIGIGIQNIPEGVSVAWPMYVSTKNKRKSFIQGFISAIVEPVGAVLAFLFANIFSTILPFLLTFAASCMFYVSCLELITESYKKNRLMSSFGLSIGFLCMMLLDILL